MHYFSLSILIPPFHLQVEKIDPGKIHEKNISKFTNKLLLYSSNPHYVLAIEYMYYLVGENKRA